MKYWFLVASMALYIVGDRLWLGANPQVETSEEPATLRERIGVMMQAASCALLLACVIAAVASWA